MEVAHGWNDAVAWARSSAALVQSSGERYRALHDATVATVMMVLPAGMSILYQLRYLPT